MTPSMTPSTLGDLIRISTYIKVSLIKIHCAKSSGNTAIVQAVSIKTSEDQCVQAQVNRRHTCRCSRESCMFNTEPKLYDKLNYQYERPFLVL